MYRIAILLFSIPLLVQVAFAECSAPFCVGMVLPLSGPVGQYGVAIRNGVAMAQEQFPGSFSNIQFIYEDSEYQPAKSVAAFKKLAQVDRVHLIYTFGGTVSEVVAPVGQQLKIATLISSIDPRAKLGKSYVLRFSNPEIDFGKVLAEELKRISARRIKVVLTENYYLNALIRGLKDSLHADQELTIVGTFKPTDQDFKSIIATLGKNPADALGVFLLPGQASQFYRELVAQKISVPTFGSDVFESETEIKAAQGAMEGAFIAHHEVGDSFRKLYLKQFGDDYQIAYAGQGYDLANLLSSLFDKLVKPISAEEILFKLRSAKPQMGATGPMQFISAANSDEYFSFPVVLRRIENGQMITAKKVSERGD